MFRKLFACQTGPWTFRCKCKKSMKMKASFFFISRLCLNACQVPVCISIVWLLFENAFECSSCQFRITLFSKDTCLLVQQEGMPNGSRTRAQWAKWARGPGPKDRAPPMEGTCLPSSLWDLVAGYIYIYIYIYNCLWPPGAFGKTWLENAVKYMLFA